MEADHRETADLYHGVIVRRDGFRVILCRDGIQWILQKRMAPVRGRAAPRWRALGYFTTRAALVRLWHAKTGSACEELDALPERIKRGTQA
ncbi:hypothetical protein OEZ60_04790 [Defluviimonas sp. WL0024]|uniref:Uncharacterized protein n=1 Tax=Albidovulum salinarum TaxID=2984153 RepID=A0ABT2X688_9RHOB|nr:hypothetical protein [Defluviimonas sp. WL0024]MCU9847315.1 hypothetical protein [Defluviimonas sp. WL0024]